MHARLGLFLVAPLLNVLVGQVLWAVIALVKSGPDIVVGFLK